MTNFIPSEIREQVDQATSLITNHLPDLKAIHLYGSALDGGLKPNSDIDLLVTLNAPLEERVRQELLFGLLNISAPPGTDKDLRALEVTFIRHNEVVPWRYPARRELQFGEWLRKDLVSGVLEQPTLDHDLAILLTKVRQSSLSILGPEAKILFEPIPKNDFRKAMTKTISLWNSPEDWKGDEGNVVLTLARIWYSASTGNIASKDVAAAWALECLPLEHRKVLQIAREAYLGHGQESLSNQADRLKAFIDFVKASVASILEKSR